MIEKTKKFTVLEVEDIERLVSEMAGTEIKISDIDFTLIDCVPLEPIYDGIIHVGTSCEVRVNGEEITDEDYATPLDEYMPEGVYIPEEDIFAFDTGLFKSYERYTDSSD